jgi:hypothetical protein
VEGVILKSRQAYNHLKGGIQVNRISLKGYKTLRSPDSGAMSATILLDGKTAGEVYNGGHGGPNEYYWTDKTWAALRVAEAEAAAWNAALPEADRFSFEVLDVYVEYLANELLIEKKAATIRKKGYAVVAVIALDADTDRIVGMRDLAQLALVEARFPGKPIRVLKTPTVA